MSEAPVKQATRLPAERAPVRATDRGAEERFRIAPLVLLLAGTFMTLLDFFIVNVAIPDLQSNLQASASDLQFVVAAYGLAMAVGLITSGRMGDIVGRRRMFAIGMGLFVIRHASTVEPDTVSGSRTHSQPCRTSGRVLSHEARQARYMHHHAHHRDQHRNDQGNQGRHTKRDAPERRATAASGTPGAAGAAWRPEGSLT